MNGIYVDYLNGKKQTNSLKYNLKTKLVSNRVNFIMDNCVD